jgi:nonribosomal peptide synthetase protein VioO
VDAISEVAERRPESPALIHDRQIVTYSRMLDLVDTVAGRLGPRPGVVAVPVTHSPATVVGLLGIWAVGGTYCPVDPGFPAPRRAAMRAAVGATDLPASGATDVGPPIRVNRDPDDPAYILFTSGSTGAPKPVLTPHRAIGTVVPALRDLFGLTAADRVLQFASLNWDTCFEEILPTLVAGAAVVFDDEAHTGSFPRFLRAVDRQRVTVLDLPTAYWHELVHHLVEDGATLPASVRLVVIGGEAVSPARLADWRALDTGRIRLLNTYGCTETTLITHAIDLGRPAARAPIGHALPHVRERITADGELLIGGPAVSLGYHGLPEATAARFVSDDGEGRFFRTGDRVKRRPDGALELVGRVDDEVKVRGIRVDPTEAEAAITSHPAVGAAAVVGATVAGRTALIAYVVPRPGVDPAGLDGAIVRFLRERVPAHLVPTRVSVVSALVHTASGKVDRAASHRRHTTDAHLEEALR